MSEPKYGFSGTTSSLAGAQPQPINNRVFVSWLSLAVVIASAALVAVLLLGPDASNPGAEGDLALRQLLLIIGASFATSGLAVHRALGQLGVDRRPPLEQSQRWRGHVVAVRKATLRTGPVMTVRLVEAQPPRDVELLHDGRTRVGAEIVVRQHRHDPAWLADERASGAELRQMRRAFLLLPAGGAVLALLGAGGLLGLW